MTKNVKKNYSWREHAAIQNMRFSNLFLLLWVIFALLDPDPNWIRNRNPAAYRIDHALDPSLSIITVK
jgi:hypothetical protein